MGIPAAGAEVSATNRGAVRSEGDFYRTPRWCVDKLLKEEAVSGYVLDPGCGDGAISLALQGQLLSGVANRVLGVEQNESLASKAVESGVEVFVGDFLDYSSKVSGYRPYTCVVGNPPYRDAAEWVRAALRCVNPGGKVCFLLRLGFLGSARKRMDVVGPGSELSRVYVLGRRPSFTGDSRSDAASYAWFVWIKGCERGQAALKVVI